MISITASSWIKRSRAKVAVLLDLVRETLLDRYQDISVRAFAHIAVALDYFLVIKEDAPDSICDTQMGGYADDLKRLTDLFERFDREINAFIVWRSRQPAE